MQYPEVPRVEYALSGYGQELQDMLDHFCAWGARHAGRVGVEIGKLGAHRVRA
jgi:DNA-binding HxlR family transcriptional regulator